MTESSLGIGTQKRSVNIIQASLSLEVRGVSGQEAGHAAEHPMMRQDVPMEYIEDTQSILRLSSASITVNQMCHSGKTKEAEI